MFSSPCLWILLQITLWTNTEGKILKQVATGNNSNSSQNGYRMQDELRNDATNQNITAASMNKWFVQYPNNSEGNFTSARKRMNITFAPPEEPDDHIRPATDLFAKVATTRMVKKKKCIDTDLYDSKSKQCRKKYVYSELRSRPSIFKKKKIYSDVIFPNPNQKQTCKDLQIYHRNEYTMSAGGNSAVIIKKTGEVIHFEDYYINDTETANESQVIYVCRKRFNCSKEWQQIGEGEFLVLENKSILVDGLKRLYDKSDYIWQNRSVLVCDNFSLDLDDGMDFKRVKCSGDWGLMESDEFTILANQSIYVDASRTLYDPTQYVWQNQNLFVCYNFTEDYVMTSLSKDEAILSLLTMVCMLISIISLVFVLVTYSLFAELRTPPGINIMNLSVAILLSQLLWLLGSGETDKPVACAAIAVLLHYFFLVSFVWTSIIAFDTWRAFTAKVRRPVPVSNRKKMMHILRYMAVAWLSVMVYVVICVALDQSETVSIGYGSRAACWIINNNAKWIFFATPLGLVTIFNIVFFSMTVRAIRSTRNQARMVDNSANKPDFGVYVRIASVMGFTWIFGFAAPFGWVFLWYVYVILSSLQGIYIAVAFALNKRARKLYFKMCKTKESASSDGPSGNGRTVESVALFTKVISRKGQTKVVTV